MKYICILICLLFTFSSIGQAHRLCNLDSNEFIDFDSENEFFDDELDAIIQIGKLLKKIGLPMNFQVRQCKSKFCKENAFATMDTLGTRYIVYDNDWFNSFDSTSNNILSLTILAHELGHHLAAHTLFLNENIYKDAIKYCNKHSKHYDPTKCNEPLKLQYSKYLQSSRQQELQADRFAGYIMSKYGFSLEKTQKVYKLISKEYNDTNSTHPTLSKRLKAVEAGHKIATKNKSRVDLFEIKGSPININIRDTTLMNALNFRREVNFIKDKLKDCLTKRAFKILSEKSPVELDAYSFGGSSTEIEEKIVSYLGYKDIDVFGRENMVDGKLFQYFDFTILLKNFREIKYNCHPAYYIKDGVLSIILFENDKPKIIYKSPFSKDEISFEEIEALMLEVYDHGINQSINNHKNDE